MTRGSALESRLDVCEQRLVVRLDLGIVGLDRSAVAPDQDLVEVPAGLRLLAQRGNGAGIEGVLRGALDGIFLRQREGSCP